MFLKKLSQQEKQELPPPAVVLFLKNGSAVKCGDYWYFDTNTSLHGPFKQLEQVGPVEGQCSKSKLF